MNKKPSVYEREIRATPIDKVDWKEVSEHAWNECDISIDFIREYADYLDWHVISYQRHTIEFYSFPQVELSLDMALAYLRSEALILPDQPAGYLLMTYQGVPLGFVKNIGNHCNNLYPNEWRIRHK